jgi:4-pyridoxate dehydrogenase
MAGNEFDTIIIGAGSAGCVLADRLTEDGGKKVLVLEAGGQDRNWLISVPLGVAKVWSGETYNWSYQSEPEPFADNRSIFHPRGKVVGGSSSINMMAYVRGNRGDYDRWRQKGMTGWSYEEVLPYFRRMESFESGGDAYHGGDGPLGTRQSVSDDPAFTAFKKAGEEMGYPINTDFNGATQDGFTHSQSSIRDGKRCSAAVAYLRPALKRGGVKLETGVHVTRILFDGKRAVGVEYLQGGQKREARCGNEIIVSGGAINSPQILMLSGIGPAEHLKDMGIDTLIDQPGVGANLQDHAAIAYEFAAAQPTGYQDNLRLDRLAMSMVRAYLFGTGFATSPPGGMTAFVKSAPHKDIPDIQLFARNGSYGVREWFPGFRKKAEDGFTLRACHLRPESRGSITLASNDPKAPPRILNNFLQADEDRRVMRECFHIMRRIARSKAFSHLAGDDVLPSSDIQSDDEIDAYVRENVATVYHPIGTCRIGSDPESVVDLEFRVRGAEGLRVVDASVMPDLVGGNINAPVMMIAEKASDIIRGKSPLPAAEGV